LDDLVKSLTTQSPSKNNIEPANSDHKYIVNHKAQSDLDFLVIS
jgi:hypothetical protein